MGPGIHIFFDRKGKIIPIIVPMADTGRILTTLIFLTALYVPLPVDGSEIIYAFRNYGSERPEKMILVGEIRTKTKVAEIIGKGSPYSGYDSRKDQVTVKVHDRSGIKVGQTLYVIDKDPHHREFRNGFIVGEIVVKALFHSPFYGWVLTGTGNLLRIREGTFVARTLDSENLERAFVLKKRGDHYANRGDIEQAIASYHGAVEADRSLPEAHAALGILYLDLDREANVVPIRSLAEFALAYEHRNNFRYNYERFQFYDRYMDALYDTFLEKSREGTGRTSGERYLNLSLEIGKEAFQINRDHPEIRLKLFRVHYHRMELGALQRSVEERKLYDDAKEAAGRLLVEMAKGPISDPEAHRVATLFCHYLLEEVKRGSPDESLIGAIYASPVYVLYRSSRMMPAKRDPGARIVETIRFHIEHYKRYLEYGKTTPDKKIETIAREVSR